MVMVNLTPHDVVVFDREGNEMILPASGFVARCDSRTETIGEVNGIPITRTVLGSVNGLPDPADGIVYIVSRACAERVPEREDVFFPAGAVRDGGGRIIGCTKLGRI